MAVRDGTLNELGLNGQKELVYNQGWDQGNSSVHLFPHSVVTDTEEISLRGLCSDKPGEFHQQH